MHPPESAGLWQGKENSKEIHKKYLKFYFVYNSVNIYPKLRKRQVT